MHVRVSTVHRNGRSYRYAQLVESFRRPDGMPAHRVLASLGECSDVMVENLRTALRAGRLGQLVLTPSVHEARPPIIDATLQYLDVRVLVELWRALGLSRVIDLAAKAPLAAAVSDVVLALCVHRCLAPGSKLSAQRWFPTTALAEILPMSPRRFNNSRIHRAMSALDDADEALQSAVATQCCDAAPGALSLFLDVTDTWFVGAGPPQAERGLTKEGLFRRRIGIVLLCDQRGFPLRWKVVRGKAYEAHVMGDLVEAVQDCPWTAGVPLVCDRMMGRDSALRRLCQSGARYVTAVPRPEWDRFSDALPQAMTAHLKPTGGPQVRPAEIRAAIAAALSAGMTAVADDPSLLVLDLGVCQRGQADGKGQPGAEAGVLADPQTEPALAAVRLAAAMQARLRDDVTLTHAELGRLYGYSRNHIQTILRLNALCPEVLQEVESGEATTIALRVLRDIAAAPSAARQIALLAAWKAKPRRGRTSPEMRARQASGIRSGTSGPSARIRCVLYFNAEMFIEKYVQLEQKVDEVEQHLQRWNARLRSPRTRIGAAAAEQALRRALHKVDLNDTFSIVHVPPADGNPRGTLKLVRNEDAWRRRRRYLGFVLLVAHPELPHSADALVALYRAKDTVERDFREIKSVLDLRPVRHRTDPKVRAHVSLCMLALLLERALEEKLRANAAPMSAPAALELLRTCHLSSVRDHRRRNATAVITQPTPEQKQLLERIGLSYCLELDGLSPRVAQP
jgi:hypothetical protein